MLIIYAILILTAGAAIGYYLGKNDRRRVGKTVHIDEHTFAYLIERDNELWELEKSERSRLRYISPMLINPDNNNNTGPQDIFLN